MVQPCGGRRHTSIDFFGFGMGHERFLDGNCANLAFRFFFCGVGVGVGVGVAVMVAVV